MAKRSSRSTRGLDCRLIPAHLKQIRRMRRLVETARGGEHSAGAGAQPEAVRLAEAYLVTHASCEVLLLANEVDKDANRSDAGSGSQVCPVCRKRKSSLSIDSDAGMCIKCKYAQQEKAPGVKKNPSGGNQSTAPAERSRRTTQCPVCLQRVALLLTKGDGVIAPHKKQTSAGRTDCKAAGRVVLREKTDAMDHRVSGSFEAGRRR